MTNVELRIAGDHRDQMLSDLSETREWAGYLLCGSSQLEGREVLFSRDWIRVPDKYEIHGSNHGFSWHSDFDVAMLNRIQKENLSAVVLHYHGGASPRLGATSDRETANSLMPFLSQMAPGRTHVFGVLGEESFHGLTYIDGNETGEVAALRISTSSLINWSTGRRIQPTIVPPRHNRMILGFGEAAFRNLRAAKIGVVGCGGGGSHLVQQLAYLGVGAFVLIDADRVEETNLNRLIGARAGRVGHPLINRLFHRRRTDVGRLKVEVLNRLVNDIDENIAVEALPSYFPSRESVDALRECDIVVACVDKIQVRDDLNRLCKRYLIPLLDVGLEITPSSTDSQEVEAIPGRVTKVLADGPCLRCQGVVSDARLLSERGGQPMGYTGDAHIADPAVVTLNGVVASIAATEVLQLLTGFAGASAPNCGWIYDGLSGRTEQVKKGFRGCSACNSERGLGDFVLASVGANGSGRV